LLQLSIGRSKISKKKRKFVLVGLMNDDIEVTKALLEKNMN
jgi:hypothetical protein